MDILQAWKMSWSEFSRRAETILKELQKTLLPQYAEKIIAINVKTGEYVLGDKPGQVEREFKKRFPNQLAYIARVDGGPATTGMPCEPELSSCRARALSRADM